MGGSGICGYILKDLIDTKPVFICNSYNLPKFIDKKTLVFTISYSGNTKETINMYRQAKRKTKKLVIITSGGKLGKVKNTIIIPKGLVPRQALAFLFFPMWKIINGNVKDTIKTVSTVKDDLGIAKKLHKKLPVIDASAGYYSAALRWKQQINENSKRLAIANVFPEVNHNQVEAVFKNSRLVFLKDKNEKAIKYLKDVIQVKLKGKSKIAKLFYGIAVGDNVSINLAKLNKENYLKYKLIEKLKKR